MIFSKYYQIFLHDYLIPNKYFIIFIIIGGIIPVCLFWVGFQIIAFIIFIIGLVNFFCHVDG